jgi:hypothetical protein
LDLLVAHDFGAVDAMNDFAVAVDLDFGLDPGFASEGVGNGVEAVGGPEFAVADDVGAGSAEVTGVPGTGWVST